MAGASLAAGRLVSQIPAIPRRFAN